jgi:hypothetical protein
MSENTAQQISKSEGEWLEKIEHSKAIAINVDEDVESEKTICTFEDGSKLMFSIPVANVSRPFDSANKKGDRQSRGEQLEA